MTERFINDIDIGQLIDTKGELSTIDYSDKVDFYELWEFLNKLNDENEELKKVLGAILLEVKRDISNTHQSGEIKVFINPNSFELISEVLRKYGALKGWYE